MRRASPSETRKVMEVVDVLVREGVRFVPVPAFSDEEFEELMKDAGRRFDAAANKVEQLEKESYP